MKIAPFAAAALLFLPLAAEPAGAQIELSQFWPVAPGYSWKGVGAACGTPCTCPGQFYDVLALPPVHDPSAFRVGPSVNDCYVIKSTGTTFTWYGTYGGGVPTTRPGGPISLGVIPDGFSFQVEATTWVMIRDWSAVNGSAYPLPSSPNLVVWVWYDTNIVGGNPHHAPLEFNLPMGTVPPAGNITDVEWFAKGEGPYAYMDVDAVSGNPWPPVLDVRYGVSLDCNGNGILDRVDISSGFSTDVNGDCVPDECDCVGYCPSLPNATGNASVLSCSGDPNTSLVLTSTPVPNTTGQFFLGPMALLGNPFGDGILCVGGAVTRLPPFVQAGMMAQPANTATLALDYGAPYAAGLIGTKYFQHWFRSGLTTGAGSSTSSGLAVTF